MAQYLVPITDRAYTDERWEKSSSYDDYWELLGEEHASPESSYDSTYAYARWDEPPDGLTQPPAGGIRMDLGGYGGATIYNSGVNTGHKFRIRWKRTYSGSAADDENNCIIDCTLALYKGAATLVASKTLTVGAYVPGSTWTSKTAGLSTAEAALITDYDDLWLSISASPRAATLPDTYVLKLLVSHIEFEIPGQSAHLWPSGIASASVVPQPNLRKIIGPSSIEPDSDSIPETHAVLPEGGIVVPGMASVFEVGSTIVSDTDLNIYGTGSSGPRLPTGHRIHCPPKGGWRSGR